MKNSLVSVLYILGKWISKPETAKHPSESLGSYFLIVAYGFPNDEKTQQRKKWKFEFEDSAGN